MVGGEFCPRLFRGPLAALRGTAEAVATWVVAGIRCMDGGRIFQGGGGEAGGGYRRRVGSVTWSRAGTVRFLQGVILETKQF
jgi:hypothetical protein